MKENSLLCQFSISLKMHQKESSIRKKRWKIMLVITGYDYLVHLLTMDKDLLLSHLFTNSSIHGLSMNSPLEKNLKKRQRKYNIGMFKQIVLGFIGFFCSLGFFKNRFRPFYSNLH